MISSRSLAIGRSLTPNICATEGPYRSQSQSPTRAPVAAKATARFAATVDFPTPPLPDATAITRFTPGIDDFPTPEPPAAAGASLTSMSTFTLPIPGTASNAARQSLKICSGTLGSRVETSIFTTVTPSSTRTSLTKPNDTISRENPGYLTCRKISRMESGFINAGSFARPRPCASTTRNETSHDSAKIANHTPITRPGG